MGFLKMLFSPIVAVLDFITKYFKTFVFLVILVLIFGEQEPQSIKVANLQQINLVGPILDVDSTLKEIKDAYKNDNIKGVLFNVNSPGGAVAPSVEIAYAIKELSSKKPVVAYASGVMASGGYYASIWASKIIANPGSMIGSIGVIFQGANVEKLMETLGVQTQTVKVGKYKEAGTFSREWNSYEKAELEKVIKDTYSMFVTDVANARKLDPKNHDQYADAHIFTARQAQAVGLVDKVATLNFAQNELYNLSGISSPIWVEKDKMEQFLDKVINEVFSNFSIRFSEGLKAY